MFIVLFPVLWIMTGLILAFIGYVFGNSSFSSNLKEPVVAVIGFFVGLISTVVNIIDQHDETD